MDDRFNHGGAINDFMVKEMHKDLDFFSATRYGKEILIPSTGIYGPKVMLINEMAGSGGDIFPYLFKQDKTGPLVGKRTWGAMISNYGFNLLDGGRIPLEGHGATEEDAWRDLARAAIVCMVKTKWSRTSCRKSCTGEPVRA